jgi:hypothetical protein
MYWEISEFTTDFLTGVDAGGNIVEAEPGKNLKFALPG